MNFADEIKSSFYPLAVNSKKHVYGNLRATFQNQKSRILQKCILKSHFWHFGAFEMTLWATFEIPQPKQRQFVITNSSNGNNRKPL